MLNKIAIFTLSALSMLVQPASATILTFDDYNLLPDSGYPTNYQGPIGFTELGYQFSDNIVVYNVSGVANGPAYSGNNAAFNDYAGYGYNGDFTITAVGGNQFSFADVFLQSWSHSSATAIVPGSGEIQGNSLGYRDNNLVAFTSYSGITSWSEVSGTSGVIGSFANIDELVISPTVGPNNANILTLVDNLELNGVSSGVPEPSTWALMILGFGGMSTVSYRRLRRSAVLA
jgi:hypothetical protein